MSLIIKGVDMPKSGESITYSSKEIIEIPRPHGRLIDADKLMETRLEPNHYEEMKDGYIPDFELDCAPTIIEAEVSE